MHILVIEEEEAQISKPCALQEREEEEEETPPSLHFFLQQRLPDPAAFPRDHSYPNDDKDAHSAHEDTNSSSFYKCLQQGGPRCREQERHRLILAGASASPDRGGKNCPSEVHGQAKGCLKFATISSQFSYNALIVGAEKEQAGEGEEVGKETC